MCQHFVHLSLRTILYINLFVEMSLCVVTFFSVYACEKVLLCRGKQRCYVFLCSLRALYMYLCWCLFILFGLFVNLLLVDLLFVS